MERTRKVPGKLQIHQEGHEIPGLVHGPSTLNLDPFLWNKYALFNQTTVIKMEI
jgi:hypothetical protein